VIPENRVENNQVIISNFFDLFNPQSPSETQLISKPTLEGIREGNVAVNFENGNLGIPVLNILNQKKNNSKITESKNLLSESEDQPFDMMEFVNLCKDYFQDIRSSNKIKKGSNILIINKESYQNLPPTFIDELVNFINLSASMLGRDNLFFFHSNEKRFLLPTDISTINRLQRVFVSFKRLDEAEKLKYERLKYRSGAFKLSRKLAIYLFVLSEMIDDEVNDPKEFFEKINSNYEGESIQYISDLEFSLLETMHDDGILTLESNGDELPTLKPFEGYVLPSVASKNKKQEHKLDPNLEILSGQAKEKPEKIVSVINSADKVYAPPVEMDEKILRTWSGSMKLRDFKYRSNVSMRGRFILTNNRLIIYRKKFGIFPAIPFIGYVRPNNRMMFIILRLISYISRFRHVVTAVVRTVGLPVILAFILGLDKVGNFTDQIPISFPDIPGFSNSFDFLVENPEVAAGVIGGFSGLSMLFRILFFRSLAITVIPLTMFGGLQAHPKNSGLSQFICKPRGSDKLPGLSHGLPFTTYVRSQSLSTLPSYLNNQSILLSLIALSNQPTSK
jgi:hypothetical protein